MDRDAAEAGIALKRVHRQHSMRELTRVQAAISSDTRRASGQRTGLAAYGINPDTNSVEIGVEGGVTAFLTDVRSTYGNKVTVVRSESMRYTSGRFNDRLRYYAGDRIVGAGGSSCTSGFTVTNAHGLKFALTSGHCFPQTTPVSLARADNTTYAHFGWVDYRRFGGGNLDNALIGVDLYAGRMWSSPNLGDDQSQSLPVHSAADSCTGCQVYINGSYHGIRLATLRGTSHCRVIQGIESCGLQLIASTDGRSICGAGDSGGPVFAHNGSGGVIAVGIQTAANQNGTECLYTRIVPILAYWVSTITIE